MKGGPPWQHMFTIRRKLFGVYTLMKVVNLKKYFKIVKYCYRLQEMKTIAICDMRGEDTEA